MSLTVSSRQNRSTELFTRSLHSRVYKLVKLYHEGDQKQVSAFELIKITISKGKSECKTKIKSSREYNDVIESVTTGSKVYYKLDIKYPILVEFGSKFTSGSDTNSDHLGDFDAVFVPATPEEIMKAETEFVDNIK